MQTSLQTILLSPGPAEMREHQRHAEGCVEPKAGDNPNLHQWQDVLLYVVYCGISHRTESSIAMK